jgi:hypothetical protein
VGVAPSLLDCSRSTQNHSSEHEESPGCPPLQGTQRMGHPFIRMEAPPSPLSSRPERSAVEGSAVLSTSIRSEWKHHPPLCHPDRSAAQWRDLQFSQPASDPDGSTTLPFVIPTEAQRSGGICSSLNQHPIRMEAPPSPLSSDRSEAQWRDAAPSAHFTHGQDAHVPYRYNGP